MPTYSALTTLPGEEPAQSLAAAMERMTPEPTGVGVFEIEDGSGLWEVGAYFLEAPDQVMLEVLATAFGARPFALSEVPEVDWVAHVRRELSPVDAGRFFVFGSHDADKVPADRVPLQIEATVAFGTGHHGTTLGCLQAFDRLLTAGWRPGKVADIGCGTAVLAMAAAKTLPEALVIASDIDRVAVDVAEANIAINGLDGKVECLEAAGLDHARIRGAGPSAGTRNFDSPCNRRQSHPVRFTICASRFGYRGLHSLRHGSEQSGRYRRMVHAGTTKVCN
jgi:ribosomal protein L11 methyltransferase